MPNDNNLGASFSIDTTNLKAGLAQANRLIRESESEFKAAAAGMDDWQKSEEGLTKKIKSLNDITAIQQKKVDALQKEYDELIRNGLDPASKEATELRTKINNETAAMEKNKKQAADLESALAGFRAEADKTGKTVDEVAQNLDEAGDKAEDAGDGFTVAKGAVATFIGNGLSVLVGACKNAITSILGLAESTREYRTIMASLENSSKAAGYSVDETADTFKQLNGVLGDTQSAATTTANLQAIGLEQSKLTNLTNGVIGAWAKYGDSIPIDGLGEAINHTIKLGETQGTLADVLEWGGISVDDFNKQLANCTSETERADLIQKMLAEQGLVESGKAWQENNKSIVDANNAQAEYDKTTAKLGEKIEPLTNKFNELKTKALQWLIDTGLPSVNSGFEWVKDNIPAIVGIIGTLTAAWLTFGGAQKIVDGWNKAMALSQSALNAVMKANPIGLVITAITALVTAFVLLWNNCEGFRNFWIGLWDALKNAAKAVADWFVQAFTVVGSFFSNLWTNIKNGALALWNGIKAIFVAVAGWFNSTVIEPVKRVFTGLWDGLKNGALQAWNGIKSVFSSVATFFKDIFSKAWQGVKNVFSTGGKIFDGIKDGIVKAFKTVVNAIIKGINKVVALPFKGLNSILNKIEGISIAGIKPFDWLNWRAPVPQLPLLAKGGIVRKATNAIIGENGAEAVLPLEKNTGYLKTFAKEIAAEVGQGVVVNQTNNYSQSHSRYELWKSEQNIKSAVNLVLLGGL